MKQTLKDWAAPAVVISALGAFAWHLDSRFDAVNQRFDAQRQYLDARFTAQRGYMDVRFDAVDARISDIKQDVDYLRKDLTILSGRVASLEATVRTYHGIAKADAE